MVFTDASTGFVVGESNAGYKTTDGGNNWTAMTFPDGIFSFQNVQFLNSQYGFLTTINRADGILRTTNSGTTWQYVQLPYICEDVFFVNPAQGYATTKTGLIKSIDSGKTWAPVPAITFSLSCIWFFNNGKGFFTNALGTAKLYRTPDAGNTFSEVASTGTAHYSPLWFGNGVNGCAGIDKQLHITNDAGTTWTLLKEFPNTIIDAKNNSASNYYVSTSNELWHTTDAGATWLREMKLGANQSVVELTLAQPGKVWAAGGNGRLYFK